MINNRIKIEYYNNYSILQERNYKNEGTIYSIVKGNIDSNLVNGIQIDYSYFVTIEEAREFIDNLNEDQL